MKIIQIAKQILQSHVHFIRASLCLCFSVISGLCAFIFVGDLLIGSGSKYVHINPSSGGRRAFAKLLCWLSASLGPEGMISAIPFLAPTSQFLVLSTLSMGSFCGHTCWAHSWITVGLKDSGSLTTSFFPVTKPGKTLVFFLMSLISCASLVVRGTNEILFSNVLSLPLSSHVCFDIWLFPLHLQHLAEFLHSQPTPVKVCWVTESSCAHLSSWWIRSANLCPQPFLLCWFFWLETRFFSLKSFPHSTICFPVSHSIPFPFPSFFILAYVTSF